jgi:hypothetical protein
MRTPGFTAEASLAKASKHYRATVSTVVHTAQGQGVHKAGSVTPASQPAHPFSPSVFCDLCVAAATVTYDGCAYGAATAAAACGLFYPACFALLDGVCTAAWGWALGTQCHLPGFAQTFGTVPGPPCCPVFCGGSSCCATGETCAAAGLCCSPGFMACGTNCCAAGETCLPNGTCCSPGSVCGTNCCAAGETCLPGGTCCSPANVCGTSCCAAGETCLPDGSCCPAGHAVCGGVCCPNPNSACDPVTNACTCSGGAPTCGGTCCAPGQLCCNVLTPTGFQPQCYTPLPPRDGFLWCGERAPNEIFCNNCAAGQQCVPISSGGLASDELYCQ